jgi:cyclic peptide transporter
MNTGCGKVHQAFYLVLFLSALHLACFSQEKADTGLPARIDREIRQLMEEGDIPGLSIVMIKDGRQTIKSYGYADLGSRIPVTDSTLFQIGSCSKAFTSLALATLVKDGKLNWEDPVSRYLPWFRVYYKDEPEQVTLLQLLHHSSGIPWNTIAKIPASAAPDALEKTVRQLIGQPLRSTPGEKYEYATINYDVLALIIQQVSGQPFEDYVQEHVLDKLQLKATAMGLAKDSSLLAKGYKISFFRPREYEAPVFRGNNAAGYVISNITDLAAWLKFQMGLLPSELYPLAQRTQQRDETVPLHGMYSYAMGWDVSLNGKGEIMHDGLNPNYTASIIFRPAVQTGVAVLANSNSSYTPVISGNVMKLLMGEKIGKKFEPGDNNDKVYSLISCILGLYILIVTGMLFWAFRQLAAGKRKFEPFSSLKYRQLLTPLLIMLPFLYGIYLYPKAFAGFSWQAVVVWSPAVFITMVSLLLGAMLISYIAYSFSLCFPAPDKIRRNAPQILVLSILSGLANMVVIAILTSALYSDVPVGYIVFYYLLALSVYLLGIKFVQTKLIKLNTELVYDLRTRLVEKIFSTSYQQFETIDRGRIYTTLNDDVSTLADSINTFVTVITSLFTALGAFLYLASIASWATVLTAFLIMAIALIYYWVSKSTNKYFEQARDTQNTFMRLVNGLIDGFKELSLHRRKKMEYSADVADTANEYRKRIATANIRFMNAFLVGESLLVVLLGGVVFALPRIFVGIPFYTIMSFVIILLYLIGPVNSILNSLPALMRVRVVWKRIRQFLADIPASTEIAGAVQPLPGRVESLRIEDVSFKYALKGKQQGFSVGPFSFEVKAGEILFVIGGNGSGKSTLAKILTGLYKPGEGRILINGEQVPEGQLSEYYSTVFSPGCLFEKIYNVSPERLEQDAAAYLELLDMDHKVSIEGNRYSTIDLSGGQRKRLALLQCYLENAPIYLFDEWAADQDPGYRRFFYRTLLPAMKEKGKIIIVISHDDNYFDVADKIIKLNEGRIEMYANEYIVTETIGGVSQ